MGSILLDRRSPRLRKSRSEWIVLFSSGRYDHLTRQSSTCLQELGLAGQRGLPTLTPAPHDLDQGSLSSASGGGPSPPRIEALTMSTPVCTSRNIPGLPMLHVGCSVILRASHWFGHYPSKVDRGPPRLAVASSPAVRRSHRPRNGRQRHRDGRLSGLQLIKAAAFTWARGWRCRAEGVERGGVHMGPRLAVR